MLKKANSNPSTELSTFTFNPKKDLFFDVRTIAFEDKPNDPWFVAADVCKVLGLAINPKTGTVAFQPSRYPNLSAEDVDQHPVLMNLRDGRQQRRPMWCLSESGLYKLVMRSDKPQAKKFQDWVTRDVLPAIRKNGAYLQGEEKLKDPSTLTQADLAVLEERLMATWGSKIDQLVTASERLAVQNHELREDVTRKQFVIEEMHDTVEVLEEDKAALEAVKNEMEPLVERYQHFLSSDGLYNKEVAAKILGFRGAQQLNKWMEYLGIQYARKVSDGRVERIKFWVLRSNWVERQDLFPSKLSHDIRRGGSSVAIRISPKGLEYLLEQLEKPHHYVKAVENFGCTYRP